MEQKRLVEISKALQDKKATLPCSRCGHLAFSIVDETMLSIQPLNGNFIVGGSGVPAVVLSCNNCGNLWHHALGILGLMPEHLKQKGGANAG